MARIQWRKSALCVGSAAVMIATVGATTIGAEARNDQVKSDHTKAQVAAATLEMSAAAKPADIEIGIAIDDVAVESFAYGEAGVFATVDEEQPPPMAGRVMTLPGPGMPLIGADGKVVTGAPYSAEAVTEMIQTLADDNRIVQRQTASVARDSEGRTRREMTLAAVGVWMPEDAPKLVFIHDPVAGVVYQLNDQKHTVMRRTLPTGAQVAMGTGGGFGVDVAGVVVRSEDKDHKEMHKVTIKGGEVPFEMPLPKLPESSAESQTETLGTQTIEGVEATGTRTTTTIPAGTIGNEQPIKIVSENWYSSDLQTTVLSKRSDPRFGETTYQLTNIARSEPAASLFEVPAGYTITEEPDVFITKVRPPR